MQLRLILTEKAFREFFLKVSFKQQRGIVARIACCVGVFVGRANDQFARKSAMSNILSRFPPSKIRRHCRLGIVTASSFDGYLPL